MIAIEEYLKSHGLQECDIYLLELIPLIEMIWADGRNQKTEMNLLYRFTVEHLSRVSREDSGVALLSEEDINRFIDRFTSERPDPAMLRTLRRLSIHKITEENGSPPATSQEILDYCLDIAAACVKAYPYKFNERIIEAEKSLLHKLFASLSVTAR